MVWKMFEEFHDSGLEDDDVRRIPRWLFSAKQSLIANGMVLAIFERKCGWRIQDFIYSESPCCMMPPIKFLLKRIYGLEEVVWKFQEGCLVHDHLLYLCGMKESFLSLFLAWPIQSSVCLWGHMVLRKILSEKYQDCCLVIGHRWYLIKMILYILSLHVAWFLLKRTLWFWKRNCLKNSKMAV